MGYWRDDRLSALDATFIEIEDPNLHTRVAAAALFVALPKAAVCLPRRKTPSDRDLAAGR